VKFRRLLLVFLANPTAAWMLFAFLSCLGLVALARLPVTLMPQSAREGYTILTRWGGVDGERLETTVTRPIEEALSGTAGLVELTSVSEAGASRMHLKFARGVDPARLGAELRNRVEAVSAAFPRDCEKPVFLPLESGEQSALIITVASADALQTPKSLREHVDLALKLALARLPGVGEVQVCGGESREITVALQRGALSARGIGSDRVIQALQDQQISRPLGLMERGQTARPVVWDARFKSLDELRRMPVLAPQSALIRLEDLGRVEDGAKDPETLSTLDGREKITIYLQASASARLLELSGKVQDELGRFQRDSRDRSPVETEILFDASSQIKRALLALARTLIEAMLAASLFLFLFTRRGQPWALALIALPASLIPVFFFFHLSHVGLNVVSLSGLGLAAGMALDANIVVLAFLSREGAGRRAVVRALEKAVKPLSISIACALVIFLPLLAMQESASAIFRDLALAIVFSLSLSLVFAFLLTPTLWLSRRPAAGQPLSTSVGPESAASWGTISRLKKRIDRAESWALEQILGLSRRRFSVYGIAVLLILLALLLFPFLPSESAPLSDTGELLAYLELPPGTSLARSQALSGEAEELMRARCGKTLKRIQARVETGRVSYVIAFSNASLRARRRLAADLRKNVRTIQEGFVHFEVQSAAGEDPASLTLDVLADDPVSVRTLATRLGGEISRLAEAEEILLHFREGRPAWVLTPDRASLALWDLTPEDAGRLFRDSLYGPVAIKYLESKREVDVRVRLEGQDVGELAALLSLPVLRTNGPPLPLGSFFSAEKSAESSKIWRKNRKYLASLSVRRRDKGVDALQTRVEAIWKTIPRESGTRLEWGGGSAERLRARRELALGVFLSILLIYMLLASLFQSLRLPLQVLCVIPIAMAGSILALFAFRIPLDLPVYLGWMILSGLSVNGALLLLDAIHGSRSLGGSDELAVRQGLTLRLRSAALTTGATLVGLLPMLFFSQAGSAWIRSLAFTVFWGMVFAFLATVTLIPLFHLKDSQALHSSKARLDRVWETFLRWKVRRSA
jgi:HAE1 family hydrophobic/amphiphilic exporter-1